MYLQYIVGVFLIWGGVYLQNFALFHTLHIPLISFEVLLCRDLHNLLLMGNSHTARDRKEYWLICDYVMFGVTLLVMGDIAYLSS